MIRRRRDDLTDAVGAAADRPSTDPRLEALCRGELSDIEAARLRQRARVERDFGREMALFEPLDEAAIRHLTQTVDRSLISKTPVPASGPVRRRGGRMAVVAALVAAVAIWWIWPTANLLPAYSLEVIASERLHRSSGDPGAATAIVPSSTVTIIAIATEAPPPGIDFEARGFILVGEELRPIPARLIPGTKGRFFASGPADRLLGISSPGQYEVFVVVVRRDDAPDDPAEIAARLDEPPAAWRVVSAPLRLRTE